jgi:peptidoglycan/LPS O-acetylase OafA/YrhL
MKDQIADQHFKHTYVPAFDGVRAAMVLPIMFLHMDLYCPLFQGHIRIKFLLFSQAGYVINVFFCLSGFLITWLLLKELQATGQLNLLRFYKRRAVRLFPAYLSAVIISSCLALLWGYTAKEIFKAAALFLTYTYNIGISVHAGDYTYAAALSFFLSPAWSLCIEEQFYLAWPLVLRWLKLKYALRGAVLLVVFMEVYRCGLLYYMRHHGYTPEQIGIRYYFGTDTRIHAILVGCAAALVLQNRRYYDVARKILSAKGLPFLLPVIIAVIVFRTSQIGEQTPAYQLYGAVLSLSLVAAWFVSILFQPTSMVSRVLASPPLVLVGRISYGLYIFHYLVIRVVARLLKISAPPYSFTRNLAAWFLVAVISILIATVHYRFIELPLQRRFKGAVPIPG